MPSSFCEGVRRGWWCPEPGGEPRGLFCTPVTSGQGQRCCPHPCWIHSLQPLCKARSIFSHRHLQGKISWRGHLEAGGGGGIFWLVLPLRGVFLGSPTPALGSALRGCTYPCTVFVGAPLRGSPRKPEGRKERECGGGGGARGGIEKRKKGEARDVFCSISAWKVPLVVSWG